MAPQKKPASQALEHSDNRCLQWTRVCKVKDLQQDKVCLEAKLNEIIDCLQLDVKVLADGLVAAEEEYAKKVNAPNTSQQLLKTLCWK